MRLPLGIVFALILPTVIAAESVIVRGGEHPTYTRLVLDVPRKLEWELIQVDDLRLRLEGIRADFDIQNTMGRLSANRVVSIEPLPQKSELLIALNCACEVKSFYAGPKMLVIDIYGDPEELVTDGGPPKPTLTADKSEVENSPNPVALPLLLGVNTTKATHGESVSLSPLRSQASTEDLVAKAERVQKVEAHLMRQLSRVASQGLLSPKRGSVHQAATGPTNPEKGANTKETSADAPVKSVLLPSLNGLNLRAISSIDRDFLLSESTPQFSANGERCMADSLLDVQSWAGTSDFADQIGGLRRNLVGEFDKANTAAAIKLAKTYISFGFGVEAIQALQDVELPASLSHLRAMADIVEDGRLDTSAVHGWGFDCETSAALWAAFAAESVPSGVSINQDAVLRAFGALPPSLRAHLGPPLYQHLQAGRSKSAGILTKLASLMQRGRSVKDPAVQLVAAELSITAGEANVGLETLDEVIAANGADAPAALVKRIETLVEMEAIVPARHQELAAAFAHEYRRDPLGEKLAKANILALISVEKFDLAYSALMSTDGGLSRPNKEEAASYLLDRLVGTTDQVSFLKHTFALSEQGYQVAATAENAAAKRLLSLGFAEQALAFLETAASGDIGRARRLLRATAALDLSKPRGAEAELLGLTGRDVEGLRARARAMGDDHKAARLSYAMLGEEDLAAEQAWLGAEWDQLVTLDTPEWTVEQSILGAKPPSEEITSKVLANGRALLADSTDLRTNVSELLTRHEVVDAMPLN